VSSGTTRSLSAFRVLMLSIPDKAIEREL